MKVLWLLGLLLSVNAVEFKVKNTTLSTQSVNKLTTDIGGKTKTQLFAQAPRIVGGGAEELPLHKDGVVTGDIEEYVLGIITIIAWGIIPMVFTIIGGVIYMCCQCRCLCFKCFAMKCCRDTGKMNGKRVVISFPMILFSLFLLLAFLFSAFGYVANGFFSSEFAGTGGVLEEVAVVLVDTTDFLDATQTRVSAIDTGFDAAVANVQTLLAGSADMEKGTTDITDALDQFEADHKNTTFYANNLAFPCDYCNTIATEVAAASQEIKDNAGPAFAGMKDTKEAVDTELVGQKSFISDGVAGFNTQLMDAKSKVVDLQKDYLDYKKMIKKYNDYRTLFFNGIFAIPSLFVVLAIIGVLFRFKIFFTLITTIYWTAMSLLWLLFGIKMIFGVLLTDVCNTYMPTAVNYTDVLDGAGGEVLQSCKMNTRLVDVMNMSDKFAFEDAINFDTPDLVAAFNFTALNKFEDDTATLDSSTFDGPINDALDALHTAISGTACDGTYTKVSYKSAYSTKTTFANMCSPATSQQRTAIENAWEAVETAETGAASLTSQMNTKIATMKTDMANIQVIVDNTKLAAEQYQVKLDNSSSALEPIFTPVKDLLDKTRCGFIGNGLYNLEDSICNGVVPAIGTMAVAILIMCVSGIFIIAGSIWLKRRMRKPGKFADEASTKIAAIDV